MTQINDKEYAAYMLANYTLGYIDTALFIGANLFEKYFQTMVSKKEASRELNKGEKRPVLYHYIESYAKYKYKEDVIYTHTDDLVSELHMFRDLRNDLIHDMSENKIIQEQTKIGKFILYIYFSYYKEQKYDRTIILDQSLRNTLLQDYKIKEITERMIARMEKEKITSYSENVTTFKGLKSNDFNNLFELRKKFRYLQRNLEKEMEKIGLEPTILSPIDTTSAYVWMPFVDIEFIQPSNNIIETKRNNLVMGSVSILATPLDFRIYIDFGGGDIDFRFSYQEFLQTKGFKKYIKNHFAAIEPSLKIFETRWYSAIVDEKNLLDLIDQDSYMQQIKNAQIFLKNATEQNNIITSGRNLIGFILPSSEEISKEFILARFKDIAHLYYEYLIYIYPNYKQTIKEKQKGLLDNNEVDQNQEISMNNVDTYMDYSDGYEQNDDCYDDEESMNSIRFK